MLDTTHVHITVFIVAVFLATTIGVFIGLWCRANQAHDLRRDLVEQEQATFVLFMSLVQTTGNYNAARRVITGMRPSRYDSTPEAWEAFIDSQLHHTDD